MFKYDKMTFEAYYLATTTNKQYVTRDNVSTSVNHSKTKHKKNKQTHLKKSEWSCHF